ncbi:unnamed protein product [Zymoseptoria tritici ST99CH_1E4]|uniref:Uncharacterized protein n=1 Tax=Zymoseptoria tritici ST99CH_1E4 TaxID=1276532 RepID=A0A2H1FZS1_ZYMTR|nr:unnamed protein product [Zymoseptoria tritici ST99CH_1E4]
MSWQTTYAASPTTIQVKADALLEFPPAAMEGSANIRNAPRPHWAKSFSNRATRRARYLGVETPLNALREGDKASGGVCTTPEETRPGRRDQGKAPEYGERKASDLSGKVV